MRKLALLLVFLLGAPPATGTEGTATLSTPRERFRPGVEIAIQLVNDTSSTIMMSEPWRIEQAREREVVAQRYWAPDKLTLQAGERRTWRWDQHEGDSGFGIAQTETARVPPGRYNAVVDTDVGTLEARFDIGRYFTIGFRNLDDTFVVFVRERKPIRQMKGEAKAKDKSLIVSGIVRGKARYNKPWSYSMGPGSIVLGEVFIEVCDANPHHVEEQRDEWMGQRWCPWSSYVDHVGR